TWNNIAKDPYAKTEWLLHRFGKTHALFHGIRLGPTFINENVCQTLLSRNVIFSRYLVQRVLTHYGRQDPALTEMKLKYNVIPAETNKLRLDQNKLSNPWASDLPFSVFSIILQEGEARFSKIPVKGNDMELFHFISAGTLIIHYASQELKNNFDTIKNLITKYHFVPFPPRPRKLQLSYDIDPHNNLMVPEEYPPKDGFENNRQLNVVARAILLDARLVELWKEIGYTEICSDTNNLVISGALLILFPPSPPSGWLCPTADDVKLRLTKLIELGFKLDDKSIVDALQMYENKLDIYGDILWNAFTTIRSGEPNLSFLSDLFKEAFEPSRALKKTLFLNFLKSKCECHEQIVRQIVVQKFKEEYVEDIDFEIRRKSLILSPKVYQFIIEAYGHGSEIASICFVDLLSLK
ncbi:7700_t:CDS:1, partial [Funneliformis mosseae]